VAGYLFRRLIYAVIAIWAVSVVSFLIIQLPPGDYVTSYIANLNEQGGSIGAAEAANLRKFYGIDQPVYVQYAKWIGQILRGNLGYSFEWQMPVRELLGERLQLTFVLAFVAVVFTWIVAIPIGILSAVKQYTWFDYLATGFGFVGLAVPDFLLALVLLYISFAWFGFSVGGLFSQEYVVAPWGFGRVIDLLKHLWIPVLILGTSGTAQLVRFMRANLLDELRKPYVVTARAKGLPEWRVVLKYPVRLALNPAISLTAYILPYLVSGSIIVSVVLNLPTVGPILLRALISEDTFVSGAIIMMVGSLTVLGTLISDMLLVWVDPRIKFERR
jgi:peptide/nickel transport system permease protein